ncbi:MAG TPA: IgGFc-binding protein [Polyangiaceae bacterium]|jgi:hypothetical protein|nr:IgGFc-binding protein [Polyangiaceae bacterium]
MGVPASVRVRVCALIATLAPAGCGSSPDNGFDAGSVAPGPDASTGASGDDASVTPTDGSVFVASDGSAPSGCVMCSSDLHQVLDCATRAVVKTCPAAMGCGAAGQCVAPCDSATANQSSIGCDYYAVNPDGVSDVPDNPLPSGAHSGSCFAAFVVNTWTSAVTIGASYDGQSLDLSKSAFLPQGSGASLTYEALPSGVLPPNQVAIVFLAHFDTPGSTVSAGPPTNTACPAAVTAAYTTGDAAVHGPGKGHAFHMTTSAPVVAYDIYPYGGATSYISSATLLLPTSAWDTNYVAATAYAGEVDGANMHKMDGNLVFVASEDATTVTIDPVAAIAGNVYVPSAPAGTPQSYMLDQGDTLQLEQYDDLTGSPVLADKPIGLWGGHYALFVPDPGTRAADAAHQQIPPVKALGNEYVAVRYRERVAGSNESVPWRVVGAVDGTTLTYEPSAPAGAPATLSQGQVAQFSSPGPFVVKSQDAAHPFYGTAYMTGGGAADNLGDPEAVNIVPPAQFLDHYVFFTDPTYAETDVVVVRPAASAADVTLDCQSAPLTGWQPIGSRYAYTRVDVQHLGAKVGACDNGRHEMKSSAPFGITVWGFDDSVSYAYPAGASVKPLNTVVVQPIPR